MILYFILIMQRVCAIQVHCMMFDMRLLEIRNPKWEKAPYKVHRPNPNDYAWDSNPSPPGLDLHIFGLMFQQISILLWAFVYSFLSEKVYIIF